MAGTPLPVLCLNKSRTMDKEIIILAEEVLDLYKKKYAGQSISDEELEPILARFRELVKASL